jgi:thiol:disulfide interchange protein
MPIIRSLLASALLFSVSFAHALEIAPYSDAALADAQQAGKPVAVHFHADWCSTCRAQEKALNALREDKSLDLTVLVANYDKEKALKEKLAVRAQSTLIVFRGTAEKTRLIATTNADKITAELQKER